MSADAISSILSQIRAYETQVRGDVAKPAAPFGAPDAVRGPSFGETLNRALSGVNDAQQNTASLQKAFELGDPRVDLARVMVAAQQSQVAFRATVEVRNRLVQAYQDVMNMPV